MSDTYVPITCNFIRLTEKAVLINVEGSDHWVPRSCIHGADEIRLGDLLYDDEVTLRIFQWLVDRDCLQ